MCRDRTRGNGLKLKKGRFTLVLRKKFFPVRAARYCNKLAREIVVSLSCSGSRPSWRKLWVTWSSDMFLYKATHQLKLKWFSIAYKRAMRFLCMRECIKFYLVLWWRLCKWVSFFLPRRKLFSRTTRSAWGCKPSYKPRPFNWIMDFQFLLYKKAACKHKFVLLILQGWRAEGLLAKPLLRLSTSEPQGNPQTFPLQEWGVSPLHFPCVTDACVCNQFLCQSIIFLCFQISSPSCWWGGGG